MERDPIRKSILQPVESCHLSRRQFVSATASGVGLGLISYGLYSLFPKESNKTPEPKSTSTPESSLPQPSETSMPTLKPKPLISPQQTPALTEVQFRDRFIIGEIRFIDQEKITLTYPEDFERKEMITFDNVQILFADEDGKNTFYSQYKKTALLYPDYPSETFVMSLHSAWYLPENIPLEAEPLRVLIEGNLYHPHPQEIIEANLEKIIGHPFFISQDEQTSNFVITQAKRLDAQEANEFLNRSDEVSLNLDPIENPENSFILMTCSGRQPDEPNEIFPGRYLFVLQLQP